jgi:hypothetical protein
VGAFQDTGELWTDRQMRLNAKLVYETQRLDHLWIVAGISQEISLIEKIDTQVNSVRKVNYGKSTQAIILNVLDFVGQTLYLMPDSITCSTSQSTCC